MLNFKLIRAYIWGAAVFITTILSFYACSRDSGNRPSTVPRGYVRVAGLILRWVPGNCEANLRRAEKLIRQAAFEGARIICTPESFLDGYSIRMSNLSLVEFQALALEIPGSQFFSRLQLLSKECNIYLIAGLTERDGDKIYNSAVLIGPDGVLLGTHRKNYLWYTETDRYTPGKGFPIFTTEFGRIGMMICSERREPRAIDQLAENGADFVFCLAGGGYGEENDAIVSQRSSEGHVPIIFVHPVEFLVTGRDGQILTQSVLGDDLDAQPNDGLAGEIRYYDLKVMPDSGAAD
ncbi:MAG: carbon-nitrogen hydrolase family protein [Candidatus Zixiibacteriota bacterium]